MRGLAGRVREILDDLLLRLGGLLGPALVWISAVDLGDCTGAVRHERRREYGGGGGITGTEFHRITFRLARHWDRGAATLAETTGAEDVLMPRANGLR
jgi:hypothetical protein